MRARTASQLGLVPTTLVVQFVEAAVNVAEVDVVGATAAMSGATVFDAERVSASAVVRVDAEPNPPRTPPLLVELPGEMINRLLPSELMRGADVALRALAEADGEDHPAIPMRMPSTVSPERNRCSRTASNPVRNVSNQLTGRSSSRDRLESFADLPVANGDRAFRGLGDLPLVRDEHHRAAGRVQTSEKPENVVRRRGVEVARRLVGQDERRFRNEARATATPLLPAGQLARTVVDAVGETDAFQRGQRPFAPLFLGTPLYASGAPRCATPATTPTS